jgi:hypothetical protein
MLPNGDIRLMDVTNMKKHTTAVYAKCSLAYILLSKARNPINISPVHIANAMRYGYFGEKPIRAQ